MAAHDRTVGRAGCPACLPASAEDAYQRHGGLAEVARLVDESHFAVRVVECPACGQRLASVFCETVDWTDGEDPQALRVVAITADECAALLALGERASAEDVERLGAGRRHLAMDWPKDAERRVEWRDGGLAVPPHD